MKKYLFSALALPLLFACSSDDLIEKEMISNDQFAGIEKVNATFYMDEERAGTRMDKTGWTLENGDLYGFAWLGDGTKINPATDGIAYQNHNLIQTNGRFEPQTSIYVGKYYIYRPYDYTTVSPQAINFKSLEKQTIAEGYESAKQPWKDLAKTAIIIGDKWTDILPEGRTYGTDPTIWDKPGIGQPYKVFSAFFSNQTGLDLTYKKNNPKFAAATAIAGATDISYTIAKDDVVGAADIYGGTVELTGAAKSFTYAPKAEPNGGAHDGNFWEKKKNLAAADGFAFTAGAITLNAPVDADKKVIPITTGAEASKGWFWFNSLPVTAGDATSATNVTTILNTSYGVVTVTKTLAECAYALEDPAGTPIGQKTPVKWNGEWIKIAAATDETKSPKEWDPSTKVTFINQYGNHKGKYAFEVDFSKGVMNNMHIVDDAHLQKALKYYIASGKDEVVTLNLDGASATDKTFKLSKISIALLQTINKTANKVLVQACSEATHNAPEKIIITQDGQTGELAAKKEVPALDKVFKVATAVYLTGENNTEWTWGGGEDAKTALTIDDKVSKITNEGTLTVNATNVELSVAAATLANAAGATMNITQVTTVKNALTNLGTINVGSASNKTAELRAYNVEITNDATALDACGTINNYGVVGVSDIGTAGKFNNYGLIEVKDAGAITLLSTNEKVTDFDNHFDATNNKMGTVKLPSPTALVSVANTAANGFIKYEWPAATKTYATPAGNVKYNTIVVSGDIEFTEKETEIQYIEFDGTRTQVVNPGGLLANLKGIIVNPGKSIIIEKGNKLAPLAGTFLGAGATVYNGGTFTHNAKVVGTTASNYFGDWQTTQIVKY